MYDRLLTAREVAERLSISRSYAYYLICIGEIPSICIRRAVRVPPRERNRSCCSSIQNGPQPPSGDEARFGADDCSRVVSRTMPVGEN